MSQENGLSASRATGGGPTRSLARARRAQAALAAGAAAAPRQRRRLDRAADRRAVGRVAAGDGRQERPGVRLPAAQAARRRAAGHPRARATSCGSIPASSTWPASTGSSPRPSGADPETAARQAARGAGALARAAARRPRLRAVRPERDRPSRRSSASAHSSNGSTPSSRPAATPSVIGELEALVADHPLRERLRGQLMLGLYRSGRQAEALATYQAARRALVDELGIEPGRQIRELHQAILAQDPSLDLAPRRAARRSPAHREWPSALTRRPGVRRARARAGRARRRPRRTRRRAAGGSSWSAASPGSARAGSSTS